MESLNTIGIATARLFDLFSNLPSAHSSPEKASLECERFRLWAANLGLYQQGHSSLDYRLRDADSDKVYISDILKEINDHLINSEHSSCCIVMF